MTALASGIVTCKGGASIDRSHLSPMIVEDEACSVLCKASFARLWDDVEVGLELDLRLEGGAILQSTQATRHGK